MQLIVEQLALKFGALDSRELATAGSIPDGALRGFVKNEGAAIADGNARLHHNLVDNLGVGLQLKVTFLVDRDEAREKSLAWDSTLVELEVAIVDRVVAQLGTDVSYFDTL